VSETHDAADTHDETLLPDRRTPDARRPDEPGRRRAYEHVIVPFDGSPDAQRAAMAGSDVASLMGAELVMATIGAEGRRVDDARKNRAVHLSDERATVWVEPGHSSVVALQTMVHYRPHTIVCMYTHARTGVLHAVYGSLADQLLQELDAPLLLIGPRCRDPKVATTRHLVVCVDHTDASATAVDLAASWAGAVPDAASVNTTTPAAPNATVVYAYERDEIVADVDELIAPLAAMCPIVEKVAIARRSYLDGVLDIVRHSSSAIVVTAWSPSAGFGRMRHDPFLSELSLKSPVPILVQRPRVD